MHAWAECNCAIDVDMCLYSWCSYHQVVISAIGLGRPTIPKALDSPLVLGYEGLPYEAAEVHGLPLSCMQFVCIHDAYLQPF